MTVNYDGLTWISFNFYLSKFISSEKTHISEDVDHFLELLFELGDELRMLFQNRTQIVRVGYRAAKN